MKNIIFCLLVSCCFSVANAQFVAKMEVKDDIPGICDKSEVYAPIPSFKGQVEAACAVSKDDILMRLNADVAFLKDKPKYKDKGMVNVIVNCKGEAVLCRTSNKTQSEELDAQILAVFTALLSKVKWSPASINDKEVDSSLLYSFKIKNGKFYWS